MPPDPVGSRLVSVGAAFWAMAVMLSLFGPAVIDRFLILVTAATSIEASGVAVETLWSIAGYALVFALGTTTAVAVAEVWQQKSFTWNTPPTPSHLGPVARALGVTGLTVGGLYTLLTATSQITWTLALEVIAGPGLIAAAAGALEISRSRARGNRSAADEQSPELQRRRRESGHTDASSP